MIKRQQSSALHTHLKKPESRRHCGSVMPEPDSTSATIWEVTDVGVDRTIEERVMADAREGEGENLLSEGAEKEI